MRLNRLFVLITMLVMMLALGDIVYAQSPISCGLSVTDGARPAVGVSTGSGPALLGATANASDAGHTEVVAGGPTGTLPAPGGGRLRVICNARPVNPGVVVLTISFGVSITNTTLYP